MRASSCLCVGQVRQELIFYLFPDASLLCPQAETQDTLGQEIRVKARGENLPRESLALPLMVLPQSEAACSLQSACLMPLALKFYP